VNSTSTDSADDRIAVAEVVARLAAAQDACDWDGLRDIVSERVHLDLSRHLDVPAVELSADEFAGNARRAADGFTVTHHSTSNIIIALDGDQASCHAHIVAYHLLAAATDPNDAVCVMRGTWQLGLRKNGADWLIEQFTVIRTAPLEGNADLFIRNFTGAPH
jgi:SnoaL-like domain